MRLSAVVVLCVVIQLVVRLQSVHSLNSNGNGVRISDRLLIETDNGWVRGTSREALGNSVDVFLGIPFAQPPIGDLRFKKPVPIGKWPGVVDADRLPNSCYQETWLDPQTAFSSGTKWNANTPISEDCLYLNVWVPFSLSRSHNATTMIWIHGGGYTTGTSTLELYDGAVLAGTNDVIVASINYRLDVFGFFYLGHEEAPGNMGLYDQLLAIQWIRDNIRHFGGDPDSITLFGESAGAGSVSTHLLSPVSRDSFKRAIMESGSVNAPWGYIVSDKAKSLASNMVNAVGCNASLIDVDTEGVMQCMRAVEAHNLISSQMEYEGMFDVHWAPTVDGVFLPSEPDDILNQGNFGVREILMGTTRNEDWLVWTYPRSGSLCILYEFFQNFTQDSPTGLTVKQFETMIDKTFKYWSPLARKAIKLQYKDWESILERGVMPQKIFSDILGDSCFVCPMSRFAQKFVDDGADAYYYQFEQQTSNNPWGEWMGVLHGDEADYVFGKPFDRSLNYTESERELSRRMMDYFTTFAKTGRPVADDIWPKFSRPEPRYLVLDDNPEVKISHGPRATACAFWNELINVNGLENSCTDDSSCQCGLL